MQMYTYVYMCVYILRYVYIQCRCVCIHVYICVYMCICVYTCVYVCVLKQSGSCQKRNGARSPNQTRDIGHSSGIYSVRTFVMS